MDAKGTVFKYGDNIDTDVIIPARYLNTQDHEELASHCMEDIDKDFIKDVKSGDIIVAGDNFGCGSSREHAPWALDDYGFRCIIAPSFADIFYNNCFKNGLLPLRMTESQVSRIFDDVKAFVGYELIIDLPEQVVRTTQGEVIGSFEIDAFRKNNLLNGLDEIGLTLQHADDIRAYEERRFRAEPWLQASLGR